MRNTRSPKLLQEQCRLQAATQQWVTNRRRMGEGKEIWQRLFFVLDNNKLPDDHHVDSVEGRTFAGWRPQNLHRTNQPRAPCERKVEQSVWCANKNGANLCIQCQWRQTLLNKDDYCYLLFRAVRDRGYNPIDNNMNICIPYRRNRTSRKKETI